MTVGEKPARPAKHPGGRPKGRKNQATLEREEAARVDLVRQDEIKRLKAEGAKQEIAIAAASGYKLAKEVLSDFMQLFAGMAASAQPWPPEMGKNPNEDPAKFKEYAVLAVTAAKDLAPFQSPRYSAMMIGASVVTKVEVKGGMPDDFVPTPDLKEAAFAPGTIITADYVADDEPVAPADVTSAA